MAGIGIVLAAVLAFAFFTGDRMRTNLESTLVETKTSYEARSRKEAGEHEAKTAAMEEEKARILAEMNQKIEEESKRKTELYAFRIKELEDSLKAEEVARKTAETELNKHKTALAQAGARLSADGTDGLLFEHGNKNLETLLKETASAAAASKRDKEDAELAIELFQKDIREKSREDFRQRAGGLENRLLSLQQDKKVLEDKWSEAMSAVVKMEETADKIELELRSGGDGLDGKGGDTASRQARLQSDMETLKKTREEVRKAMEKVRGAVESSMDAETKMMMSETSQISESLGKMFAVRPGTRAAGLEAASEGTKDKIASLNNMVADLNLMIKETFKEDSYSTPEGELKVIREMAAKLRGRCEEQLQALTGGKRAFAETPFDIYKSYVVKKGDTLWGIASRKEVYGNPYWWPLLYKYNEMSLKNPDLIEPDLTLTIRRDSAEKEISEAIERAKKHILMKRKTGTH
ncbi:MAG: LysM peptidoglycan-binding domain-containing protein [Deltaproteobacteria bacterium]|nr:LysM peptidoglycan-binding domain-containing protein [Deltaproteobacteria bacterium]